MSELVRVEELKKHFPVRGGLFGGVIGSIKAVDGVSFSIRRGETLGLVGETGCGKSTVGRVMLGLNPATFGRVYYDSQDLLCAPKGQVREMRRHMQMVFQDPFSSLDPRMNVFDLISEGIVAYRMMDSKGMIRQRVEELMTQCGLFAEQADRYAHQFSGGQRQRICIARALATEPDFIVLDEAVSALDVSIQAQILNLLLDLQDKLNLTYLFISHDLNIVQFFCDNIAVMYLGQIVEYGSRKQVCENPMQPYTRALLSAIPAFTTQEKASRQRVYLHNDPPSAFETHKGCLFEDRCPDRRKLCAEKKPELVERGDGHYCRCLFTS